MAKEEKINKVDPKNGKYWVQVIYGVIHPDGEAIDYHSDAKTAKKQCLRLNEQLKRK